MNPACYSLAAHGGAGVVPRAELTPEREEACRAALATALAAGESVLRADGSALDAVTASVQALEDAPVFNAGRGSVLARDGGCEMDAAIMDGATRAAGAVAAVRRVRNPILAARAVMERTAQVLLAGPGADAFAEAAGLPLAAPAYFITEARRDQWHRVLAELAAAAPSRPLWPVERATDTVGTVGAVARDRRGNLAAATSTGGLAGKPVGRVGDSPLIGAGTYADNATCAVSATGHGEWFIRGVVAHDIAARMRYGGLSAAEAARRTIEDELRGLGGEGGVIVVDRSGNIAMPFNTVGMYRASVREGETGVVGIYP